MQGVGCGLMEELQVEDGRAINLSLGDYKLPTMRDAPPLTPEKVYRALLNHTPGWCLCRPLALLPAAPTEGGDDSRRSLQ
jgi:hypothetical protein